MNYVITLDNIIITIDNEPFIVGVEDTRYNALKQALENFQPEYIIKHILNPNKNIDKAINALKGNFRDKDKEDIIES